MQTRTRWRAEPNSRDHEQLRSTADQAGIEQRFLRGRVKRSDPGDFARSGSQRGGEARSGQLPKAPFGPRQRFGIARIKLVARVASLVHHDLGCHVESPHAQPCSIKANLVPSVPDGNNFLLSAHHALLSRSVFKRSGCRFAQRKRAKNKKLEPPSKRGSGQREAAVPPPSSICRPIRAIAF